MEITEDLVSYVAELSRIKLDEQQTSKMQKEIGALVEYMEILNTLDTSDIEPISHVFDVKNVLRKDEVRESYDRSELLKNAPDHTEESLIVPKTVE
jgi:aspartyl-tRNA(Asn)/glutamyl-tRNA(Gln) amidotransferase subunit C